VNKENKTGQLLIRVTSTEKKNIQEKALAAHMSVSSYMIKLSEDKKIIVAEKIPQLLYEISKIGTNINQVAKIANTQKFVNNRLLENITEGMNELEKLLQKILSEVYNDDEHAIRSLEKRIDKLIERIDEYGNSKGNKKIN
jgi:GTPase involved in cell partitioning and DNA repair